MERWRQPYLFPIEISLFYLLVSSAWLFLIWKVGIPYIEIAERNPWPFISPAASSALAAYGFTLTSLLIVAGGLGVVWWKLSLKAHYIRMLSWSGRIFNYVFRNCMPPWLGLIGGS